MHPTAFVAGVLTFNEINFGENLRLKMNVFRPLISRYQARQASKTRRRMLGDSAGRPSRFVVENHLGLSRLAQVSKAGGGVLQQFAVGRNGKFQKSDE
ncbi:MAG: hypothetical protein ACLP2Y_08410 [Limisphaerales bacterium]